MYCEKCGSALGNKSPLCPKCHTMMSKEQLQMRKEMNQANNPYMQRLEDISKKNEKYRMEKNEDKNVTAYFVFIALAFIVVAIIVAFSLMKG